MYKKPNIMCKKQTFTLHVMCTLTHIWPICNCAWIVHHTFSDERYLNWYRTRANCCFVSNDVVGQCCVEVLATVMAISTVAAVAAVIAAKCSCSCSCSQNCNHSHDRCRHRSHNHDCSSHRGQKRHIKLPGNRERSLKRKHLRPTQPRLAKGKGYLMISFI